MGENRFHDLRHTFAQMMTDAGVAEAEIVAQRDKHVEAERAKATRVIDFLTAASAG